MVRRLQYLEECRTVVISATLHDTDSHSFSGENSGNEYCLAVQESKTLTSGHQSCDGELVHGKNRSSNIAQRQW
jgi:hypothetical protein